MNIINMLANNKDFAEEEPVIKVSKDGPYLVSGSLPLEKEVVTVDDEGMPLAWQKIGKISTEDSYALCRCGHSGHKPFCDGSHIAKNFIGSETASREPFESLAKIYENSNLTLKDAHSLCAGVGFCDRHGGTWELAKNSTNPASRELAIEQCANCPSGRLVACDKETGQPLEPHFAPVISVTEDPKAKVSGPLWVKGGVPIIAADGERYETRNRVTLCRCGLSGNKPFCDSAHYEADFNDGDDSLEPG